MLLELLQLLLGLMSPYNTNDTLGRHRDPRSGESIGSAAFVRSTTRYTTPSRSLSNTRLHTVERDSPGRLATPPNKDQKFTYASREGGEVSKTRNEFRDEDQRRYEAHRSGNRSRQDAHRPYLTHSKDAKQAGPLPATVQRLYEAQSIELDDLRHKYQTVLKEKEGLGNDIAVLQHRHEEQSSMLATVYRDQQATLDQMKQINEANTVLRLRYEEQMKRFNIVYDEHQTVLGQKQKAEEEYATLWKKYEAQNNEYNGLSNKYRSLKATLEQRTSELQGVQKFLTTADTFSGAEVVNMLRKLNEEVQQNMTYLAEWAVENLALEIPRTDQMAIETTEQTRMSKTLGTRLMRLLRTRKHRDNPILVEMAFRAYLIYSLYMVASPWGMGEEEQSHNAYIGAIYQRMQEKEGQAISGNWRALTRTYTVPACIGNPQLGYTIDTTIISGFSDILLAAGCTASKIDIASALWTKFANKIRHFVSLAGHLNKIIGVGVISENFEILAVNPEAIFDDKLMEDSYDSGERMREEERPQESVLCATELGLMQRVTVEEEVTVIKPKVALVSVLDVIDQ